MTFFRSLSLSVSLSLLLQIIIILLFVYVFGCVACVGIICQMMSAPWAQEQSENNHSRL